MTNVKHYPVGTPAPDTGTHYRVKVYLAGNTLELTSRTEPQLSNGHVEADWVTLPGTGHYLNWGNISAITWKEAKQGGGLA